MIKSKQGEQKECKYVHEQLEWQMEHHQHLKTKMLHTSLNTCTFVLLTLLVPYRGKFSREKTFMNFAVL